MVGPNGEDRNFRVTEVGDATVVFKCSRSGKSSTIRLTNVLISSAFPFHIFSEVVFFEGGGKCDKELGTWQFLTETRGPLFTASQQLRVVEDQQPSNKLYFADQQREGGEATLIDIQHQKSGASAPVSESPAHMGALAARAAKISTAKNLAMLVELHVAHDHWNFEDVAARYNLTLPTPLPDCWACLLAKPRKLSHDKVSTRRATRPFEGISADAKGPLAHPTPEGFVYYFVMVCLYSHVIKVL